MSSRDGAPHSPLDSPIHSHPFRQFLKPFSPSLVPEGAQAGPLPLAAKKEGSPSFKKLFFAYSCVTMEAHILSLVGADAVANTVDCDWLSLLYVVSGDLVITQAAQSVPCSAGHWLLIPPQSTTWQSGSFSVVCVMISSAQLVKLCNADRRGPEECLEATRLLIDRGCVLLPQPGQGNSLLMALHRALQTLADLLADDPAWIGPSALEDYLGRLLCLLILPSLLARSPESPSTLTSNPRDPAWDALLAYIETHLDQPLSLALLQNQYYYSKRALQYSFKRQFGCTATQWIRARRLDQARALLCHPAPADSVASIAQACGYRSMSLFSIEFQQRFHIKPSILLRQSRHKQQPSSTAAPADD